MSVLFFTLLAATPAEKPGVAVMDMQVEAGLTEGVGNLLNERLIAQLEASKRFGTILGASDIRQMLDLEQQKSALGCGDSNCLAELGGALGVPFLITSSVGKVGSRLMLNIKVLEVEEARVAARTSALFDNEDQLVDGLTKEVSELVARALPAKSDVTATTTNKEAKAAAKSPGVVTPSTGKSRPYSITGLVAIAAGIGAFAAIAPSTTELTNARQAYDDALTQTDLEAARTVMDDKVATFGLARTLGVGLSTLGVWLNARAYWRAR